MMFRNSVGFVILLVSTVTYTAPVLLDIARNDGEQQQNEPAGSGLWNSIGENLKMPGEAMPTKIHLPHEENPSLIIKDSVKKMAEGNFLQYITEYLSFYYKHRVTNILKITIFYYFQNVKGTMKP